MRFAWCACVDQCCKLWIEVVLTDLFLFYGIYLFHMVILVVGCKICFAFLLFSSACLQSFVLAVQL